MGMKQPFWKWILFDSGTGVMNSPSAEPSLIYDGEFFAVLPCALEVLQDWSKMDGRKVDSEASVRRH
jgi:hypothetical protein